jgi:hypothetical protein
MSRQVLRDDDLYEVIAGWDPPLRTYFENGVLEVEPV